ncbi:hypothetical protein RQP46_002595 [Phenoliferia psychrophenolica]
MSSDHEPLDFAVLLVRAIILQPRGTLSSILNTHRQEVLAERYEIAPPNLAGAYQKVLPENVNTTRSALVKAPAQPPVPADGTLREMLTQTSNAIALRFRRSLQKGGSRRTQQQQDDDAALLYLVEDLHPYTCARISTWFSKASGSGGTVPLDLPDDFIDRFPSYASQLLRQPGSCRLKLSTYQLRAWDTFTTAGGYAPYLEEVGPVVAGLNRSIHEPVLDDETVTVGLALSPFSPNAKRVVVRILDLGQLKDSEQA